MLRQPQYQIPLIAEVFTTYFSYEESDLATAVMNAYISKDNKRRFLLPRSVGSLLTQDVEHILVMTGQNETIFQALYEKVESMHNPPK